MTGVACIRLEEQVEKFVEFFLRPGQAMSDVSCLGLRKLVEMFTLTREITKEMRALTTTTELNKAFEKNVEKLLQKIKDDCPDECSKVPYLHALRDHVAALMEFWHTALGWGYGYFSCMASEHLNKLWKENECEETNFGNTSLLQAVVKTHMRAFFYPTTLFMATTGIMISCSACNQPGHNRTCPEEGNCRHLGKSCIWAEEDTSVEALETGSDEDVGKGRVRNTCISSETSSSSLAPSSASRTVRTVWHSLRTNKSITRKARKRLQARVPKSNCPRQAGLPSTKATTSCGNSSPNRNRRERKPFSMLAIQRTPPPAVLRRTSKRGRSA